MSTSQIKRTWSHQCAHFQAQIFSVTTRDPLGGHGKKPTRFNNSLRHTSLCFGSSLRLGPLDGYCLDLHALSLLVEWLVAGNTHRKDRGTRGQCFSLLCFFVFSSGVFLTHPVSLLLSTLRVSWCTCHSLEIFVLVGWISRPLDALSGWRFQPIPRD